MGKLKSFFKKVAYALGANLLSLMVSFLTTLIIPKFFGNQVEQYGYFQIYLFYSSYIGFFHFGWCDGVLLRDGGKEYKNLNKPIYSSQFWLITVLQLVIAFGISIVGIFFVQDENYSFVCFAIALSVILYIPRTMLSYYLQATNRIKEYAAIMTSGRIVYGVAILLIVLFFNRDYRFFVGGDIIGLFVSFLFSIWWCRDIVFFKPTSLRTAFREAWINVSVGIKLLFANIASLLVTGIVRWGIQNQWDVETYGKISFSLSVSNLILSFISAIALVLYPTLRRADESQLPKLYYTLRNSLMIPLLGFLLFYSPIEHILMLWLPQYEESMRYMAILFPMCVYAAKMTMLVQTYMNVFRLENLLLKINLIGVFVAIVTTFISVFVLKNLTCAMGSIVFNQMFRCIYAEIALAKRIKLNVIKDIIYECCLCLLFIAVNCFFDGWRGLIIYFVGYLLFLLFKHSDIRKLFWEVNRLLKYRG